MTKMTYVAALNYVLTSVADLPEDVTEKLTALRDAQVKRNSAERKPTKAQTLNVELAEVIAEVLSASDNPMTVSEIMGADTRLSVLSNQKVSAVLRTMGDRVVKTTDKRKSYFSLA